MGARQPVRRYTLKMSRFLLILLVFAGGCRSAAASPLDALAAEGKVAAGGEVAIDGTIDGDTLRLADGRELRLAAIGVPLPARQHPEAATSSASDRRAAAVAALAEEARQTLAALTDRREAQIYYEERRNDRYGRIVAHVVVTSGPGAADLWLEAELARRGLARVETTRDTAAAAAPLLAAEAEARVAKRGLWALPEFQVRDAGDLGRWRDSVQVVGGHIAATHKSPGRTWLEFAGARGQALELDIPAAANRLFRAASMDPPALVGTDVRVRGWLRWQNGPIIEVDHPAQIELLGRTNADGAHTRKAR